MKTTSSLDEVVAASMRIAYLREELKPWRERLAELTALEAELRAVLDPRASLPMPQPPAATHKGPRKGKVHGENGKRIMQVLRDSEEPLIYKDFLQRSGVPRSSFHKFLTEALRDDLVVKTGMGAYAIKNRDKSPVAVLKALE